MFESLAPLATDTPAIVVELNPGGSAPVVEAASPKTITASLCTTSTAPDPNLLPPALVMGWTYLDLSDTGGSASGDPDSANITPTLVEGSTHYQESGDTIQGMGVDISVTWSSVKTAWLVTIYTMDGLSWTGIGSRSANNPSGTYMTVSFSEAGSGFVTLAYNG